MPDILDIYATDNFNPDNYDQRIDALVYTPHSGDSAQFLAANPRFAEDVCGVDEQTLLDYMAVEHDFGTDVLGRMVVDKLREKVRGVVAVHINATLPRSICDPHRDRAVALREVFDHSKFSDFADKLRADHVAHHSMLRPFLARSNNVLDLHSMGPETPNGRTAESIVRSAGVINFADHVRHWTTPGGEMRPVDLFTWAPNGRDLTNPTLNMALIDALPELDWQRDLPYRLMPIIKSTEFAEHHPRRVSIPDFPKHLIAKGDAEHVVRNLHQLEIDEAKVEHLAEAIANALAACIMRRD